MGNQLLTILIKILMKLIMTLHLLCNLNLKIFGFFRLFRIFQSVSKKIARTKTKVFLDSNGQNLFRTVDETSKNQTVWPQKSSKKRKIMTDIAHFPQPGQNYPYIAL